MPRCVNSRGSRICHTRQASESRWGQQESKLCSTGRLPHAPAQSRSFVHDRDYDRAAALVATLQRTPVIEPTDRRFQLARLWAVMILVVGFAAALWVYFIRGELSSEMYALVRRYIKTAIVFLGVGLAIGVWRHRRARRR